MLTEPPDLWALQIRLTSPLFSKQTYAPSQEGLQQREALIFISLLPEVSFHICTIEILMFIIQLCVRINHNVSKILTSGTHRYVFMPPWFSTGNSFFLKQFSTLKTHAILSRLSLLPFSPLPFPLCSRLGTPSVYNPHCGKSPSVLLFLVNVGPCSHLIVSSLENSIGTTVGGRLTSQFSQRYSGNLSLSQFPHL